MSEVYRIIKKMKRADLEATLSSALRLCGKLAQEVAEIREETKNDKRFQELVDKAWAMAHQGDGTMLRWLLDRHGYGVDTKSPNDAVPPVEFRLYLGGEEPGQPGQR